MPNMTEPSDFWTNLYQQSQQHSIADGPLAVLRMNHDLGRNVQVDCATAPWVTSPAAGVRRIVLERDGGETTTRATSLVAYQAGSRFATHTHPHGEEILVLNGVFSDQHGDYPAGSYLRNPPGSAHAPYSNEGCLIFVKLQQFSLDDSVQLVLGAEENRAALAQPKVNRRLLFERPNERVELIQFGQAAPLPNGLASRGFEVLVLKGELAEMDVIFPIGSWLRCAPSNVSTLQARAGTEIYVKSGHLGEFE